MFIFKLLIGESQFFPAKLLLFKIIFTYFDKFARIHKYPWDKGYLINIRIEKIEMVRVRVTDPAITINPYHPQTM